MKTINIKNGYLESLIKVLSYDMPFQQGRIKNKFGKMLAEKAQLVEKNRLEIINSLCTKDDKGNPVLKENNYQFTDENMKKFNEEYIKLMEESVVFDGTPSFLADLGPIKNIINNSKVELNNRDTFIIEEIIKEFDKPEIKEVSKKKEVEKEKLEEVLKD